MRRTAGVVMVFALAAGAGCGSSGSPLSPSSRTTTVSGIDAFVGTWTSGPTASAATATPATTTCTRLDYQLTKSSAGQMLLLQFKGSCLGIDAQGSGSGTLRGAILDWNATGTASRGTVTCPFAIGNSTATLEGQGIRVDYSGSVCGLPVRGSELLLKP